MRSNSTITVIALLHQCRKKQFVQQCMENHLNVNIIRSCCFIKPIPWFNFFSFGNRLFSHNLLSHMEVKAKAKQEKTAAHSDEKKVSCLQVPLCWCVLAGAAFASVGKHREICSAVLPLSTMEDSRGWLTGFGAASGIRSQDSDHGNLQVPLSEWWLFTLQQAQMSHWICQHQMHSVYMRMHTCPPFRLGLWVRIISISIASTAK